VTEPEDTLEKVVEVVLGQTTGKGLAVWATAALASGFDSLSLRILAGLDLAPVSMHEAEPIFWRSLEELGIQHDRRPESLLRRYARDVAEKILSGRVPVQQGLDLIHGRVVSPLEHSWDLMPWCYLWEGNDPFVFGWPPDARTLEQRTLVFARQFVEAGDQPTELAVRLADRR
jgi:hypothetical protein